MSPDKPEGRAKTRGPHQPTNRRSAAPRSRFYYAALLLVVLLVAGIRFHLRIMPLERDEGEYAYAGQLILQGIPPYALAYNMSCPALTRPTRRSWPCLDTSTAVASASFSINAATSFSFFYWTQAGRIVIGPLTGFVAGTTYAVLSNCPSLQDSPATPRILWFCSR